MFLILITISVLLLFNMMKIKHPLSMGFFLIIQVFIICMMNGIMSNFFWFSYIFFLTMIGGLLIIFIYMTSLASNEFFNFSYKNLMFNISLLMLLLLMLYFYTNQFLKMNFYFNNNMNLLFYQNELYLNLNKLYNISSKLVTLMSMLFLFITLITIIKITNIFLGPLRQNLN
uniref:NADH-ubiquinone oxidoreductase chain 6 n=1 Tax=Mongoloraphidia harmandi TaxID=633873 RepID=C8YXC7_9NEOP|nr:NADH dehydrogenase subunit 6 [Mongoloraphidia harmandi]ACO92561.1 NADH dehydrogenase subunit 6 [Mongoloraphidia harmandi]